MRPGFTLIEFTIIIGIFAALAILSTALTTTTLRRQEFDRVRETIRRELLASRSDTIAGTNDAARGVAFFPHAITSFQGASYATRNSVFDVTTNVSDAVTISGVPEIDFLRPNGATTASSTVTISDGTRESVITVTAAGVIDIR